MRECERPLGSIGARGDYSHLLRLLDDGEQFANVDLINLNVSVELTGRIEDLPLFAQMPVHLFEEEWISLAFLKDKAHQTLRNSLALAQPAQHLRGVVLRESAQLERTNPHPNQLFQSSDQRRIVLCISVSIGPDDYDWELSYPIGQMNQKRQRGFVGPMKVLNDIHLWPCLSSAGHGVGNALEKIAALLR